MKPELFIDRALPFSHWGRRYFDIRLMEYQLADSLFGDVISKGGAKACDIGCGIGLAAAFLSQFFEFVEGTDIEELGVAFNVKEPSPIVGQSIMTALNANVALNCGDSIEFLASRKECFDFVFSHFVMEHVPDLPPLCQAIFEATKPGGVSLHIVPNTHDTIIQLLLKNLSPLKDSLKTAWGLRKAKGRVDGRMQGMLLTPITHSEFVADYRDQFEVNAIEHYLEPLMAAGFRIRDIKPMREHAYGILAEKIA